MKHLFLRRRTWVLLLLVMAATGCGRKEAPQPDSGRAAKPQIVNLQHEVKGNIVRLSFGLKGNPAGVGYQIDRTIIDPYCQCPGFWRRYTSHAATPHMANSNAEKILNLGTKTEYVFRIRAVDVDGNLGAWSKMMRVHGVDLFNK